MKKSMFKKKKRNMEKSKTVMNEDTLQSILVRLPMKDLARCKCVCKHWKSLISRHRFAVELSPAPHRTVLITQCKAYTSLEAIPSHHLHFGRLWPYTTCKVIGTCDGLICLSPIGDLGEAVWCSDQKNYISPARPGDALVWNPILKQYREFFFRRSLMDDSFFFFGFGYDNVYDYKIVKVTQSCIQTIVEIWNLYCTNGNHPRAINLPSASVPFLLTGAAPVTVNDSCHWVAISIQSKNLELVRFDMVRECFIEIPFSSDMPNIEYDVGVKGIDNSVARLECNPEVEINGKRFRLGTFNSRVCLLITTSSKVEVWCMEKNSRWSRKFEILPENKPYKREQDVVGFSADDELVTYDKDHVVYGRDPHTLHVLSCIARTENLSQVVAYVDTLVPLYSSKVE